MNAVDDETSLSDSTLLQRYVALALGMMLASANGAPIMPSTICAVIVRRIT
jgi:hypothetical protein